MGIIAIDLGTLVAAGGIQISHLGNSCFRPKNSKFHARAFARGIQTSSPGVQLFSPEEFNPSHPGNICVARGVPASEHEIFGSEQEVRRVGGIHMFTKLLSAWCCFLAHGFATAKLCFSNSSRSMDAWKGGPVLEISVSCLDNIWRLVWEGDIVNNPQELQ